MNVEGMDVQEFVRLSVTRHLTVKFGEDDPAPGIPWSVAFNDPNFILALQR